MVHVVDVLIWFSGGVLHFELSENLGLGLFISGKQISFTK